jgi:hypothetical protein
VLGLIAVVMAACGDRVAGSLDLVRETGRPLRHVEGEVSCEGPAIASLLPRLKEDPNACEILRSGAGSVPTLALLLDDADRRTLAAVFLAEIGGKEAATALLERWRATRDAAQEVVFFRQRGEAAVRRGYHYEGIDHAFYGELFMALGYAGRPVSAAIAQDTAAAIEESERLQAEGAELVAIERREDGIELRRRAPSVETAREGLRLLAMLRAPEAPSVFVKALRSPVLIVRTTAVQRVVYLTQPTDELLRALHPLLDDPELRIEAAEQVEFLLDPVAAVGVEPALRMPAERQAALVARCKQQLAVRLR